MNFKSMTKQQLKDHGETIGVKLNLKHKKDELIAQLVEATEQKPEPVAAPEPKATAPVQPVSTPSTPVQEEFDIKKYALPIVVVVALLIWLF
ncbi:MAG: hypothetical protein PSN35_07515 [Candidatus Thioglobus sp.]|uniref:hypothetical protein n=1 Tax=Candidatus Thioglobus sp. TaxID=2026721 RepID=UPI002637C299|nr:hypothetical protein [Candidatus Thioglobus sp.]MDC9727660.1 hypothetical protein [Candidatus Thioglobus sp.]